jgi:hypothetical protein
VTFIHGRFTYISVDSNDLSQFVTTSNLGRTADSHDVTTYGKNSHVFAGGLLNGTGSMQGVYDDGETGPRAILEPLIGTVVELVRRPEGTGSGKPQDTVDVLVTNYTETNPVAEMVTWQCDFQLSDDVATTDQGA